MIINVALLIISLIALYLALTTYFHNRRSPINISFSILTLSGAIWPLTIAMFRMSQSVEEALFWDRLIYIGGSIFPCAFVYFSKIFPYLRKKITFPIKSLIFLCFAIFSLLILYSDNFINNIVLDNYGNSAELGFFYTLWVLWFVWFVAWGFINLLREYKVTDKLGRFQLIYTLFAIGIPASLSVPFNVIMPLFGNYHLIWVGPFCILLMILIITYAITRYRLMDIRLIIKNTAIYILSFLIVILINILLLYIKLIYFNAILSSTASCFLLLILGIALFQPIKEFITFLANRYVYQNIYTYQQALKKLSQETTRIIDLDKLIDMIVDTVMKSMGLNRTGVLLIDKKQINKKKSKQDDFYKIAKVVGFDETNGISLVKNNFLTQYLQKNKSALVYEELGLMIRDAYSKIEKDNLIQLQKNMRRIEAGVCLPLFSQDQLIGLIVLGNKISNEAYTKEDLHLLETLANQASIAISNARMYQEIEQTRDQTENFNQILRHRVEEATKELKDKNLELQDLLKMKSDFLTIASHQLRTPTSIVRGSLALLIEERDGLSDVERTEFLDQAYYGINQLEKIVHNLLSATEIEGGKFELLPEAVNMRKIIENVIVDSKPMAKRRNIKLHFKSNKIVPQALADKHKIEEVVTNVIDNAIYYTPKGEINVTLDHNKDYVWFKVQDTGMGLTKKDKETLFERFQRGEDTNQVHPNGSGLGLYIVKGILDALDGKIEVESAGKNKGATFKVYLPIVKE